MAEREYLPAGTLLDGSYSIVRVVGAGGFGVTYEAEDINLGTAIAIKEYFPEEFATRTTASQVRPTSEKQATTFEWGRSGFLQEARTLARFRHPSVVRVYRIFEANATAYMVMEFEKGPSFERWLADLGRPPSQDELDHLVSPLLDALEIMHHETFLHRDIAPDNIIIRRDTTPVLLDFGAARKTIAAKTHAMTGMVKQGYSPQEQYSTDGKHQGPWSDFYALGATLYRAVTGMAPEEAPSRSIHDAMVPAVQAAKGQYRTSFLKGIDACLKVRPADRPQSVYQVRELLYAGDERPRTRLLERAQANHVAPTLVDGTDSRSLPRRPSGPMLKAGLAALVVGIVVTGGFAYTRWVGEQRDALAALAPGSGASARDNLKDGTPCPACPEMVVVPAGRYTMGSPTSEPQRDGDEEQMSVTVPRPFAVGKYAVTFDEWDACVSDGGCNGYNPSDHGWGRGRRPVINVSWDDAKAFVTWISRKTGKAYRLPLEAEREYFTRAGTITPFWWGPSITPVQANYDGSADPYKGGGAKGEYRQRTVTVGSFEPNAWGLYQVHGNVWEWTGDCRTDRRTSSVGKGDALTQECAQAGRRVVRGGSWLSVPQGLRSALRGELNSAERNNRTGFRLARTLSP